MNTIWSAKELFHFIIARNKNHLYTQVIQFSYDDIRGVLYTYFWEERWDLVQNLEFYLQFYQTNFITLKVVQYFLVLWPSVRGEDQHQCDGQERQEDGCHQHTGGRHIEYRNRHFQFLSDCLPLSVLRGVLPPVEVTECPPTAAELERWRLPLAERSEETLLPTLLATPAALSHENTQDLQIWFLFSTFEQTPTLHATATAIRGLGQSSFSTFTFPRFPIGIKRLEGLRFPWQADCCDPALDIKLRSKLVDTFIFPTTSNIFQSHHQQAI